MKVIEVNLVREIGNVAEYEVTYQEEITYTTKKAGKSTFNYDFNEIENVPEDVLDFVEKWILGRF